MQYLSGICLWLLLLSDSTFCVAFARSVLFPLQSSLSSVHLLIRLLGTCLSIREG